MSQEAMRNVVAARPQARQYSWLSTTNIVYTCCIVTLLLSGLLIFRNVTLWFDETTYYVNIRDAGWHQLLSPLPFYDQAAPFGYSAILKVIHTFFGLNEILLRLPSLAALAGIAIVASRFPGLSRLESALFCILITSSWVIFDYSTQMKHYLCEFFFIILVVSQNMPESSVYGRRTFRTACLFIAITFSVQTPIVIATVGLAATLQEAAPLLQSAKARGNRREWFAAMKRRVFVSSVAILPLVIAALIEAAKYILVTREATAKIFYNYRYITDFAYRGNESILEFYASSLFSIFLSHFRKMDLSIVLFLSMFAVGMVAAAVQRRKDSITFALLLVISVLLNAIGFYPLVPGRFSLILVLPFAFFIAIGIAAIVERLRLNGRIFAVAGVALLCTLGPIKAVKSPRGQEARQLVAAARSQLEAKTPHSHTILVTAGSQPLIDAYLGPFGDPAACMNLSPHVLGWTNRCSELRQPDKDLSFVGSDTRWFMMNYIAHVSFDMPVRDVSVSEVRSWTADYIDFLFGQACTVPDVLIVVSHFGRSFVQQLEGRFMRGGSVTGEIDERRLGSLGGDGVVLRWRRSSRGDGGCG